MEKFARVTAFVLVQLLALVMAYLIGLLLVGSVFTPILCIWLKVGNLPCFLEYNALETYLIAGIIPCLVAYSYVLIRAVHRIKEDKQVQQ